VAAPKLGGVAVAVEDDPPPALLALAADLRRCLEDDSFAEATARLRGSIGLATHEGMATLRLADGVVSLHRGDDREADLRARADLAAPGPVEPETKGGEEHPQLAAWLQRLLQPPDEDWWAAADRFWSTLEPRRGAPQALLVVESASGERHLCGGEEKVAYEIHGPAAALVAVLSGRLQLLDAAAGGAVQLRGGFADISVLSGAAFAVRFGGEAGW
jgi:hypothetical protein